MVKITAIICLISLSLYSCNKDSDEDYLEIVINGQNYSVEFSRGIIIGSYDQDGCEPVPYFISNLPVIENSKIDFSADFKHYQNDEDLRNSGTGNYQITDGVDRSTSCNFCLQVVLEDKSQSDSYTILQEGATHTVTNIKQYKSTSTSVLYTIQGQFTCSFKNSADAITSMSGRYQITVEALE
jgi:hypothetical protein